MLAINDPYFLKTQAAKAPLEETKQPDQCRMRK